MRLNVLPPKHLNSSLVEVCAAACDDPISADGE